MQSIPSHTNKIGDLLREMDVLSMVDVQRILLEQQRTHEPFGHIAIKWGLAGSEQICEAWARQLAAEQRHVDLDRFGVQPEALQLLSAEQAWRLRALPLRAWGNHLVVAIVSMSLDGQILQDIAVATGRRCVYPCYCSLQQLERFLLQHYPRPAQTPAA
ncbi:MAG: hypothetical protein HJJLKODD_01086 [Phycisphaerae bacterium]|nr:hypothetical protein [Phycisphaerae bacterium]